MVRLEPESLVLLASLSSTKASASAIAKREVVLPPVLSPILR